MSGGFRLFMQFLEEPCPAARLDLFRHEPHLLLLVPSWQRGSNHNPLHGHHGKAKWHSNLKRTRLGPNQLRKNCSEYRKVKLDAVAKWYQDNDEEWRLLLLDVHQRRRDV